MDLALRLGVPAREVPLEPLQRTLIRQGQVLTYLQDIDRADPAYEALQYFGAKGFFPDYWRVRKIGCPLATRRPG